MKRLLFVFAMAFLAPPIHAQSEQGDVQSEQHDVNQGDAQLEQHDINQDDAQSEQPKLKQGDVQSEQHDIN
jgi:hypothetical protein